MMAETSGASLAPLVLTPKEASEALRICERSLWQLTRDNKLRSIRIGRSKRYLVDDIKSYLDALKTAN